MCVCIQAHAEAKDKAAELLRTPPILPVREPQERMIVKDDRLDKYLGCKMVFTDTTQHKENGVCIHCP